jgi:2-dehydro-3-deoxyphosphogluconate aldolase/(4S)-4-hydroxy-2-oxoglutarate aldolase
MTRKFSWEIFNRIPVIGILRNVSLEDVKLLAPLYHKSGLASLEVTMNSAGASDIISDLSASFGDTLNIGAGTVCTMDEFDEALSARK